MCPVQHGHGMASGYRLLQWGYSVDGGDEISRAMEDQDA